MHMTTEKTTNSSLLNTFFANLIHDPNMKNIRWVITLGNKRDHLEFPLYWVGQGQTLLSCPWGVSAGVLISLWGVWRVPDSWLSWTSLWWLACQLQLFFSPPSLNRNQKCHSDLYTLHLSIRYKLVICLKSHADKSLYLSSESFSFTCWFLFPACFPFCFLSLGFFAS